MKPRRISLSAPLASFTFDDFAKSAWREGGKLMESYGARATYYTSGGLCGTMHDHVRCYDEDDLSALAAAGHDVGCHTFEHVAIQGLDRSKIETTLRRNADYIGRVTGRTALTSFAYPYGLASVSGKRLLGSRFLACRGIYPGVNVGWTDFSQLSAVPLYKPDLAIERYIEEAVRHNGWVIFIGHDLAEAPSPFGCTPGVLERALDLVSRSGIRVVTVDAALKTILETPAAPAQLSV